MSDGFFISIFVTEKCFVQIMGKGGRRTWVHCCIKNLSSQAYTRVFSANFAAYCVKNTCRATAFEAGFCLRTKECRTKMDCDREPACVFLPCLQQNYARKSTHISCENRF